VPLRIKLEKIVIKINIASIKIPRSIFNFFEPKILKKRKSIIKISPIPILIKPILKLMILSKIVRFKKIKAYSISSWILKTYFKIFSLMKKI